MTRFAPSNLSTTTAATRLRPVLIQISTAALLVAMAAVSAGHVQAQAQPQPEQRGPQHAMHQRMGPSMGMGAPMIPERALDAVGASAEQKSKLQAIFKAAGDDLRAQRNAGRSLQADMMALMAAPQIDAAAAEALRQKQVASHDSASKRTLQAMLDAQAVLTPEQRAKLAERMAQRRQHMDQRHDRRPHEAPKG